MSNSFIIHANVHLSPDYEIGEFAIIGLLPHGVREMETRIGPGALIRSHTVIYAGNIIGSQFQTGHSALIREMNRIGDEVSIGSHSVVEHRVTIGNRVRIHSNVFIPEFSVLEDDAWIGPNAVLTNARYPRSRDVKANLKGPHILSGAKIGANSTLLPGVVIGRNSLIGAGSVVTRDVPDGKIVAGNPARILKDVADLPAYDAAGPGQ